MDDKQAQSTATPAQSVYANTSLRIVVGAAFLALLADQVTLIVLPWLMLTLTKDPIAVSTLLAALALPRAIMILLGGSLADRISPLKILFYTRCGGFILFTGLSVLLYSGALHQNFLYPFVFVLGICTAVAMPASGALLPQIVQREQLAPANALIMFASQGTALLGPFLAGLIIYSFQSDADQPDGFVLASALIAIAYLGAFLALFFVTLPSKDQNDQADSDETLFSRFLSGFSYAKKDGALGRYILYVGLSAFFVTGPMGVGIPFLVSEERGGNAFDYGTFFMLFNLGAMLAALIVSSVPAIPKNRLIIVILLLDIVIGLLLLAFVNVEAGYLSLAILFLVGMIIGYVQVTAMTMIQKRVDPAYLGRIVGLLMFAMLGLVPVSATLAGFVIDAYSAKTMFEGVGFAMVGIALCFLFNSKMRDVAIERSIEPDEANTGIKG